MNHEQVGRIRPLVVKSTSKIFSSLLLTLILLAAALAPAATYVQASSGSATVAVPGTSDLWLAGMPDGSTASAGGGLISVAPTHSPVLVPIAVTSGMVYTFEATGSVHNGVPSWSAGPDGYTTFWSHSGGNNGIGNIYVRINSLIGVFLDDSQPNTGPEPTALNFSGPGAMDFLTLSPQLKQPFFIGDGLTSTSVVQQFVAPSGATRLFLGTMDAYGYPNNAGSFNVTVEIATPNQPPTAFAGGPYSGDEGSAIAMSGASASDPDGDAVTYSWTVNSALCSFDDASLLNPNLTCADNGSFTATLEVSDGTETVSSDAAVTVSNVAPTLGAISVDMALVPVNTVINTDASFTDPGTLDTHTAAWDWGDGTSAGTVTQGAGSGSVDDSHSYSTPGVYTLRLTVTDDDGGMSNEAVYQYVVVYDPAGGFVTGGGWIHSPAGAYAADPSLTGKATFGFVAKYKKGANVPDGNTEFQFKAGDLNFHSSSYEWLVVAGNKAQFKGVGTINGQGSYKFMIWADDDNPDTFRIHIWDDYGTTVYDNGPNQALGGGSIKIHK